MLLLLSGRDLRKCVVVIKTYGYVKLSPFRLVWDLCSLCGQVKGVCVTESHHPVQQIMVKVSKTWKQGIKSNWQELTLLTGEIWKKDYCFQSYPMPDR